MVSGNGCGPLGVAIARIATAHAPIATRGDAARSARTYASTPTPASHSTRTIRHGSSDVPKISCRPASRYGCPGG